MHMFLTPSVMSYSLAAESSVLFVGRVSGFDLFCVDLFLPLLELMHMCPNPASESSVTVKLLYFPWNCLNIEIIKYLL